MARKKNKDLSYFVKSDKVPGTNKKRRILPSEFDICTVCEKQVDWEESVDIGNGRLVHADCIGSKLGFGRKAYE